MPVLSDYDLWKTTPPGWDDLDPPDDDEPQSDDTDKTVAEDHLPGVVARALSKTERSMLLGPRRKAAAAKIAKIPFALSSWIARTYKPAEIAA